MGTTVLAALTACSTDSVSAPSVVDGRQGVLSDLGLLSKDAEDALMRSLKASADSAERAQKAAQDAAAKAAKEAKDAADRAAKAAKDAAEKAERAAAEAAKESSEAAKRAAEQAAREARALQDEADRAAKLAAGAKAKASKEMKALQRLVKIRRDEVKATIGPQGGVMQLPWAGLTVTIPRGALLFPVEIRIRPADDKTVAYEFQPHGLQFLRPLQFSQSLANTEWDGQLHPGYVRGAYFTDVSQIVPGIGALADALLPARIVDGNRVTFEIWHFSGYMMSTGRSSSEEPDQPEQPEL